MQARSYGAAPGGHPGQTELMTQRAVFTDRAMTGEELEFLRTQPWPLYVWCDDSLGAGTFSPTLNDTAVARLAFATPSVRVLELRMAAPARE